MGGGVDIGDGSSLDEWINVPRGFGSGTGVGYSEREETYLLLKQKLEKTYGKPERIKDEKFGITLCFSEIGARLIPEKLGIDFSYIGKEVPKGIKGLIIKLQTLNE